MIKLKGLRNPYVIISAIFPLVVILTLICPPKTLWTFIGSVLLVFAVYTLVVWLCAIAGRKKGDLR